MGLLEFNKLPINTLVGADWKTFKAITAGREIDPAYSCLLYTSCRPFTGRNEGIGISYALCRNK